jgi:DNA repair protein RecO (recombination protein O)
MPAYKAEGIVLHRTNLGETDRILTLLTKEHGKLNAVAKGSRKPGGRLSGVSELFVQSRFLIATGKSLDIITQCETLQTWPQIRSELSLLARAAYLCELTDRFLEEREKIPEIYDLLVSALFLMQRRQDCPDVILHAYELHLLQERGYAPELYACVVCGQSLEPGKPAFSPIMGGALCQSDSYAATDTIRVDPATLGLMRRLMNADAETLVRINPPPHLLRDAAKCLSSCLQIRMERKIKSAEFLDILRNMK